MGVRYDPDSLFFNKPCICDEDWSGDLCDISKTNQATFLNYLFFSADKIFLYSFMPFELGHFDTLKVGDTVAPQ